MTVTINVNKVFRFNRNTVERALYFKSNVQKYTQHASNDVSDVLSNTATQRTIQGLWP